MARKYETQNIVSSTVSDAFWKPFPQVIKESEPLELEDLEEMDLENMTPKQLETVATRLLWADRRKRNEEEGIPTGADDGIFFNSQWRHRRRIEMMVPDMLGDMGTLSNHEERPGTKKNDQMPIYNRSHPKGRTVASRKSRKESGSAYYR